MRGRRGVGSRIHSRRGMGVTYGPTDAQLGITPDDWFARNQDTPLTCAQIVATGADVSGTTCAGASTPGLPGVGSSLSTLLLVGAAALFVGVLMSR